MHKIHTNNPHIQIFKCLCKSLGVYTEAVRKFERLAKLCPYLVPTEEQRVKRMLEMFRPDISLSVEGGGDPPTTTTDCVERTY